MGSTREYANCKNLEYDGEKSKILFWRNGIGNISCQLYLSKIGVWKVKNITRQSKSTRKTWKNIFKNCISLVQLHYNFFHVISFLKIIYSENVLRRSSTSRMFQRWSVSSKNNKHNKWLRME